MGFDTVLVGSGALLDSASRSNTWMKCFPLSLSTCPAYIVHPWLHTLFAHPQVAAVRVTGPRYWHQLLKRQGAGRGRGPSLAALYATRTLFVQVSACICKSCCMADWLCR